jgi:hypothetical protein
MRGRQEEENGRGTRERGQDGDKRRRTRGDIRRREGDMRKRTKGRQEKEEGCSGYNTHCLVFRKAGSLRAEVYYYIYTQYIIISRLNPGGERKPENSTHK